MPSWLSQSLRRQDKKSKFLALCRLLDLPSWASVCFLGAFLALHRLLGLPSWTFVSFLGALLGFYILCLDYMPSFLSFLGFYKLLGLLLVLLLAPKNITLPEAQEGRPRSLHKAKKAPKKLMKAQGAQEAYRSPRRQDKKST